MSKYFICSILFLALFTGIAKTSSAGSTSELRVSMIGDNSTDQKIPAHSTTETPIKGAPMTGLPHAPSEKGSAHPPTMDETPHIHHFHKHRVKKLKKHHGKCWLLSKALVIACQVVLLMMAFMHVAH